MESFLAGPDGAFLYVPEAGKGQVRPAWATQ